MDAELKEVIGSELGHYVWVVACLYPVWGTMFVVWCGMVGAGQ